METRRQRLESNDKSTPSLQQDDLADALARLSLKNDDERTNKVQTRSNSFKKLTKNQLNQIDSVLSQETNPIDEVLVEKFNIQILRKDIQSLRGLNWLNDEIINFYMNLICERNSTINSNNKNEILLPSVYAFSTFFYLKLLKDGFSSIKRWTRKINIFDYDLIIIPIHLGAHWTLSIIDMNCKEIRYYDSMNGNNSEGLRSIKYKHY
jgi:sentrin-specific protease 1